MSASSILANIAGDSLSISSRILLAIPLFENLLIGDTVSPILANIAGDSFSISSRIWLITSLPNLLDEIIAGDSSSISPNLPPVSPIVAIIAGVSS